jgi:hypothetical protein
MSVALGLSARNDEPFNTSYDYPAPVPPTLSVICGYPLSGQYGPGSRYLYYGLVLVCIFARRHEWLRGACLAAALLLPAIASIHAIVLASYSDSGECHLLILWAPH